MAHFWAQLKMIFLGMGSLKNTEFILNAFLANLVENKLDDWNESDFVSFLTIKGDHATNGSATFRAYFVLGFCLVLFQCRNEVCGKFTKLYLYFFCVKV